MRSEAVERSVDGDPASSGRVSRGNGEQASGAGGGEPAQGRGSAGGGDEPKPRLSPGAGDSPRSRTISR